MQTTIIVKGDSMNGIGIYEGDELLVDRSIEAKHGNIVLAVLNNDYTVSCAGPGQGSRPGSSAGCSDPQAVKQAHSNQSTLAQHGVNAALLFASAPTLLALCSSSKKRSHSIQ
jgi:Peptidase S24-like